jgi:3-methyl-2-oxobutanoate hydroxymethyltransferase
MHDITITTLNEMKGRGEKIAVLTSYDASFTRQAEDAGVEVLLVGDSLGMVVQGHESTLPVTLEEMVYHTANVARASSRALVVADLPFMTHNDPQQALQSAGALMKRGGAHMVKLEGGAPQLPVIRALTERGVPVCGHLGLLPQSVHRLGGYRVQGRDHDSATRILEDAAALAEAGAQLLVLECVPGVLAAEISRGVGIPVIGIGAGPDTDGQVLVLYDMLGITPGRRPKFSKDFLAEAGTVPTALAAYVRAVKDGSFPDAGHSFQ